MRDDEVTAVEHQVRDELATEALDVLAERLVLLGELRQRLGQAVRDPHLLPLQRLHELVLVVARHGQRVAGAHHAHHEAEDARGVGPAVHEVAEEHDAAALRVRGVDGPTPLVALDLVAQLPEHRLELRAAAVHVADRVEGPALVAEVVEERRDREARGGDLVHAAEHVHPAEALAAEALERPLELVVLALHDGGAERAIRAGGVPLHAHADRHVEHDRDGQHVVVPGELHEGPARLGLHVGGVDHGHQPPAEAVRGDVPERLEGGRRRALVVLVVRDEAAEDVARQHLVRAEVGAGEGRLAGSARADEQHERHAGDGQRVRGGRAGHRVAFRKRASWVGEPWTGSASPTGRISTR